MKKSLIAILMTAVISLSLIAPLISTVQAVDPSSWYKTVPGVLNNDYYSLYPYETSASLKIGFSKYGELINLNDNTGLEYGAVVDPFAPPAGSGLTSSVPKNLWLQGWLINITYTNRLLGVRNVWACAMTSDGIQYGNDWIRVDFLNDRSTTYGKVGNGFKEDPTDPGSLIYGDAPYSTTPSVYGGRKTNGTAVTDPITVLYDGPREFIAVCRTTIYDHPVFQSNDTTGDIPMVQIAITILFNKDYKEVELLKDVKSLLPLKEGDSMKIQFSNRGEIDLGTEAAQYASYAHFYTLGLANFTLPAPQQNGQNDTEELAAPTVYNSAYEEPLNAQSEVNRIGATEPTADPVYSGYSAFGNMPQATAIASFDVAQAINPQAGYVWSAAFWPSLSDWSIDGWDQWWHSLMSYDPHYIDLRRPPGEPLVPFYIGEWDFQLYHTGDVLSRTQFRGVTGYAVTSMHDADDKDIRGVLGKGQSNTIDSEMMYLWNQKFNPWDLSDAATKDTLRWVEYKPAGVNTFTTTHAPVVVLSNAQWDDYNMWADKVESNGVLLHRNPWTILPYTVTLNADGTATFANLPLAQCKIMYSTLPSISLPVEVTAATKSQTYVVNLTDTGYTKDITYTGSGSFGPNSLGVTQDVAITADLEFTLNSSLTENFTDSTSGPSIDDVKTNFAVNKENPFVTAYEMMQNATYQDGAVTVTKYNTGPTMAWSITNPNLEPVLFHALSIQVVLAASVTHYNNETSSQGEGDTPVNLMVITITPEIVKRLDDESMGGRYEWGEVGRDAATVDSAGLGMVTEAFNSYAYTDLGLTGADMFDPVVANQMPSIMAKFGTGDTKADYKDAPSTSNTPGFRAALVDDWCTSWPVTSSNIIGVGGPIANMLAYYTNDLTTAMYGLTAFSGSIYSGAIVPVTCWNRGWPIPNAGVWNTYTNPIDNSVGYAVIASTIDINGTEVFMVWGNYGRDTYYASAWLHGYQYNINGVLTTFPPGLTTTLQNLQPGVNSIVLKITYTDPKHPTFSIVESLGTISENILHDP